MDENTKYHHERLNEIMAKRISNTFAADLDPEGPYGQARKELEVKGEESKYFLPKIEEKDDSGKACDMYNEQFRDIVGGAKNDSGKPALSLLPIEALEEIAKVLSYGAIKYEKNNYKQGFNRSRLLDACLRHVYADAKGIDLDEESSLPHLAHAAATLVMLIQNIKTGVSKDDR